MSDPLNPVFQRNPDMVYRRIGDESILVPVRRNSADLNSIYTLNPMAALIWDWMDGKNSVSDIVSRLVVSYEVDEARAREDVMAFAGLLRDEGAVLLIKE